MKRTCLWVIVFLVSALSVAQAQSLSFDKTNYHDDRSQRSNGEAQFRFTLFPSITSARPRTRRFGFSLMAAGRGLASTTFTLSPMAAGPNLPVLGGGTVGRLTKWTGFTSSNSFIGDSTIFESKDGFVGIGTDTPTSRLTVAGTIQSLSGGFQFPDGTIQTTSAAGSLFTVAHDATLVGNGTATSPLGVAVPLILTGSVPLGGIIEATNTDSNGVGVVAEGDPGVRASGSDGLAGGLFGGTGLVAEGGRGDSFGGFGIFTSGGSSPGGNGGAGIDANGGFSSSSTGGRGVDAIGGSTGTGTGGTGVRAEGGGAGTTGNGGRGVIAIGGRALDAGNSGGIGIEATGGEGLSGATPGLAGRFQGDVEVTGTLSKGGGSFKIDHPLDPENKYLYHSFVESPDMMNIYNGNIVTDENGEATVALPAFFEALNRDFRYQLTVIGTFAQAIVSDEIKGNRFMIRTSAPNVKVSWQVTGIRRDAWADKNRVKVEVEKGERERGFYLHPEAFDQPKERAVGWARDPESTRQMKKTREQVKRQRTSNDR